MHMHPYLVLIKKLEGERFIRRWWIRRWMDAMEANDKLRKENETLKEQIRCLTR